MPTRPALNRRRRGLADDRGSVALAMMVIVIVTILVMALLVSAELGLRGSRRAGDSANALQLADAGINHATKAITAQSAATTSFTGGSSLGTAGTYSYTAAKDGAVWRLDSVGTDTTGVRRRVVADAVDQPIFGNAFFGLTSVSLKGTADSYTGPSNPCSTSPAFGVVGSNGTITFTGGGGARNCRSGWSHAADGCSFNGQTTIPAGAVGNGACPPAPHSFTSTQKFNPPTVSVPSGLANEGDFTCPTNGTIPSGTHLYSSITFSHGCKVATTGTGQAVLYVTGPVTIGVATGNCNNVVNAPPGACGSNFANFPSTWFESGWTSKLQVNVAGNGQVSFANNAIFWGVINAPNSFVTAAGGGTPQVDVFGSVLANSATSAAQFRFHYDQALKQQFSTGQYQITNWREEPVP